MSRYLALTAGLLAALAHPAPAHARTLTCTPVNRGVIQLDGLLGDWRGVRPVWVDRGSAVRHGRGSWNGSSDLSFTVRCNVTRKHVLLAVNVKDDYFVRARKLGASDHVRISIGGRTLYVFPGDLRRTRGILRWAPLRKRRKVRGVKMAESMQKRGWSVELRLRLGRVPGLSRGRPWLPFSVSVGDTDHASAKRVQTLMRAPFSRLAFARSRANVAAFLKAKGYRASQVRKRRTLNVVGDKQLEQVLVVGRTVGVVGAGLPSGAFFYFDLPVRSARDIRWVKLPDLNGDRVHEFVVRYVERASNGRREIVAVYRFDDSNKFTRPVMIEVLKAQGGKKITNRVRFKRRRRKTRDQKRRGIDIIVDKPKAVGFNDSNYREAPAQNAYSILLPWKKPKKRTFRFEGELFSAF